MKTLIKLFLLIVILHVFFAGCSDTSSDDTSEDELETAIVAADKKATTIALNIEEVTAVTTPTIDTTPNYTFSSTKAGTITYGGSCSSSTTIAISGNNTITFNALANGTYDNCTITVTDNSVNRGKDE